MNLPINDSDSEYLYELARIASVGNAAVDVQRIRTIAKKLARLEDFVDAMKPIRVRVRDLRTGITAKTVGNLQL